MNYEEMLLNLAKMVGGINIPNLFNASDGALDVARQKKNDVIQEIHRIRKFMREEDKHENHQQME